MLSLFYASIWYQIGTGSAAHLYTDRLGLLNKTNAYMVIKVLLMPIWCIS